MLLAKEHHVEAGGDDVEQPPDTHTLWLAMLYVALESWRWAQMAPVRELTDRGRRQRRVETVIAEG